MRNVTEKTDETTLIQYLSFFVLLFLMHYIVLFSSLYRERDARRRSGDRCGLIVPVSQDSFADKPAAGKQSAQFQGVRVAVN